MKSNKSNIEQYLISSGMNFINEIDERLKQLHKEFKTKEFGLSFFINCEFKNCIADLIYMRDVYLQSHLDLCKAYKIDLDEFDSVVYRYKQLKNIEEMSILQVLQINNPWFGLSKLTIKKMNDNMIKILNEL